MGGTAAAVGTRHFLIEGFIRSHPVMAWWSDGHLRGSGALLDRAERLAAAGTIVGADLGLGDVAADLTNPMRALLTAMAAVDVVSSVEATLT